MFRLKIPYRLLRYNHFLLVLRLRNCSRNVITHSQCSSHLRGTSIKILYLFYWVTYPHHPSLYHLVLYHVHVLLDLFLLLLSSPLDP